ncbi:MAG: metallophosphoesterase family protein [Gemmatimonadaceae bacterium]
MRVAALYDIHGHVPALEAVLHEVRQSAVDLIVVGGDLVFGPMSRDAISCLETAGIPILFIRGNAELALLDEIHGRELTQPLPEAMRHVLRWEAQQLADYDYMFEEWRRTFRLDVGALGSVLFCHATPRDENEIFLRTTPEHVLLPIFEPLAASVVVCGHTHMQFDRTVGTTRIVNAGSVGMPFGEPGAYWLLLGPDVQLRRTEFDLAKAAQRIRATSYPQAEEFAANSVMRPPTEAKMLELFANFALK